MSAVGLAVRAAAASALGFALVPVLGANPAMACSCIQSTEQENYERADVVFEGTMDDVEATNDQFGPRVFVFMPSTTYKGKTTKPQKVSTAGNSAACGVDLTGGGPFLVFAYRADDGKAGLSTSLCSGTREIKAGQKPDFKAHGGSSDGRVYKGGPKVDEAAEPPVKPSTPRYDRETGMSLGTGEVDSDHAPSAPDAGPDEAVSSYGAPVAAPMPAEDTPLMLQTTAVANDTAGGEAATLLGDERGSTNYLPFAGAVAALGAAAFFGFGWARRRRS